MRLRKRRSADEGHEGSTGIDLAPMLDFVVNLLIFFIITTSFIKEAGVTVFKPGATTAQHEDAGNLLIAIRENGDIWMDRQRIELRDVRTRMERLHIERPDDTVVIIADKASKAGIVAQVMDEVRLSGIKVVSIAADPGA
jgi:biopolymer transport protein ExbD